MLKNKLKCEDPCNSSQINKNGFQRRMNGIRDSNFICVDNTAPKETSLWKELIRLFYSQI